MDNCFACGKKFDITTKGILARYKQSWQRTAKSYYYYQINGSQEIKITTADGFKLVRQTENFKEGKVEFAHISEFGNIADNNVLENPKR